MSRQIHIWNLNSICQKMTKKSPESEILAKGNNSCKSRSNATKVEWNFNSICWKMTKNITTQSVASPRPPTLFNDAHRDLHLWHVTSKINRVHPLTMVNMSAKFDKEAHNHLVAIMFTSLFSHMSIVTLTFDLPPKKLIGSILSPWLTCLPSLIKKYTTV